MSLHLVNIVKSRMGPHSMTHMHVQFDEFEENRTLIVRCNKAPVPIFVKDSDIERFYIRTGPSTTELSASQTQEYIRQRWRN